MVSSHRQEHERIRAICARLLGQIDAPTPPVDADFARARWEFARELSRHQVCGRLVHARLPGLDASLDDALRDHMRTWTGSAVAIRWSEYRTAARALIRRALRNMDREERLLPRD